MGHATVKNVLDRVVTLDAPCALDVADSKVGTAKYIKTCEITITARLDDSVETFENLSLKPDSLNNACVRTRKSDLICVELLESKASAKEKAKDKDGKELPVVASPAAIVPFELCGGGDAELVLTLVGGANGSVLTVTADAYTGKDDGPGKRTGLQAFRENGNVSIMETRLWERTNPPKQDRPALAEPRPTAITLQNLLFQTIFQLSEVEKPLAFPQKTLSGAFLRAESAARAASAEAAFRARSASVAQTASGQKRRTSGDFAASDELAFEQSGTPTRPSSAMRMNFQNKPEAESLRINAPHVARPADAETVFVADKPEPVNRLSPAQIAEAMEHSNAGAPKLRISGIDGLGFLMSCNEPIYGGKTKSKEIITNILKKSVAAGFAKKFTVDSGNALKEFTTPLVKERMDDFQFLQLLARRYGMPLALLFEVAGRAILSDKLSFEAWTGERFEKVRSVDLTRNLLHTGLVLLYLPSILPQARFFGREGCWLRMIRSSYLENSGGYPHIGGVRLNTVSAVQRRHGTGAAQAEHSAGLAHLSRNQLCGRGLRPRGN